MPIAEEADEDDYLAEAQLTSKHFHGFSRDELKTLVKSFSIMRISTGDAIVEQGETGSWAGLLLSGELKISINGAQIPGSISAGSFVGEMAVFANGRRAATISCSQSGRIATILTRDLYILLEERPAIGAKLITAFARSVMETLIVFKIPRWEPSPTSDLKPSEGSRTQLDGWLEHLRANEPGFASAPSSSALGCFQVLSFADGARLVKRSSGVFRGLAVVLDGRIECSWPDGPRTVERFGLIGEHSLFLDDCSLQMPNVIARSAGSVAMLSEAAIARLSAEQPAFYAALINLMAAEAVHQLSAVGQQAKPTKRQTGPASSRVDNAVHNAGKAEQMEVLYKQKMVAGLKLEAAAAGELAKDSAAKLERTAHTLKRYKVLALKYERERDALAVQIEEMEDEMKQVKNVRRELANVRADCHTLQEQLAALQSEAEETQTPNGEYGYLRERYEQQAKEAAEWKQAAVTEHAAREGDRARYQQELAGAERAHVRAAELEVQVGALLRAREEQATVVKSREGAARELTKRVATLEAELHEVSEARNRAQQLLIEKERALRACEEERRDLSERLLAVAQQRRATIVKQSIRRASVANGPAAQANRAPQSSAAADAAQSATIDELTRINGELAEALQEQSAALWATKRRLAHAERFVKVDARESAGSYAGARVVGELDMLTGMEASRLLQAAFGPADRLVDPSRKPAAAVAVGVSSAGHADASARTSGQHVREHSRQKASNSMSKPRAVPSSIREAQLQAGLLLPKLSAPSPTKAQKASAVKPSAHLFGAYHTISTD